MKDVPVYFNSFRWLTIFMKAKFCQHSPPFYHMKKYVVAVLVDILIHLRECRTIVSNFYNAWDDHIIVCRFFIKKFVVAITVKL